MQVFCFMFCRMGSFVLHQAHYFIFSRSESVTWLYQLQVCLLISVSQNIGVTENLIKNFTLQIGVVCYYLMFCLYRPERQEIVWHYNVSEGMSFRELASEQ